MHFTIRVSDVSALAGRNMHRPRPHAINDLLQTILPPCQDDGVDLLKTLTHMMEDEVRHGSYYSAAVRKKALDRTSCRDAEKESMQVFDKFSARIPAPLKQGMRRSLKSIYLKDRGMFMEIDTLRRLHTIDISWMPSEKKRRFFSRTFVAEAWPEVTYTINGAVDGLETDADGNTVGLLEVKNRKEKLLFPRHDIDQVTMYIVISGLPQGRLIQDVGGRLDASLLMSYEEAWARWSQDIRPGLEDALGSSASLVHSHARQYAEGWHRPFLPVVRPVHHLGQEFVGLVGPEGAPEE